MGHLLKPQITSIGLAELEQRSVTTICSERYAVFHLESIERVSAALAENDVLIVSHEVLLKHSDALAKVGAETTVMVVTPVAAQIFAHQLRSPIDREQLLRELEGVTRLVKKAAVNWNKLRAGNLVTSRVTPTWSTGIILEVLEDDCFLVLFPRAKPPFNDRPVRCHATTINTASRTPANDPIIKKVAGKYVKQS